MLTAAHCSKASPIDTNIVRVDPEIVRLGDKNIIDTVSLFTYLTANEDVVKPDYH